MLKIVSPTGRVHAVDKQHSDKNHGYYAVMCNHTGWRQQYLHKWDETKRDVNCKRCLCVLNKKIRRKETDWTKAKRGCEYRYPHLKHGVLCNVSAKFRIEVAMRKCTSMLCPMPYSPLFTPAIMVEELVVATITEIAEEIMRTEKDYVLRFNMIAVHCKHKKPAIQDNGSPHMCSNPNLKKGSMDPKFGWGCIMNNCPHMLEALVWRADHCGPRR